jgi:hypothetical protein
MLWREQMSIQKAIRRQTVGRITGLVPNKWDGHAGEGIVDLLIRVRFKPAWLEALPSRGARHLTPVGTYD